MRNQETIRVMMAAAVVATLLSTSALAAVNDVKGMENGSQVNISGTVDSVQNEREFTLRDDTGTVSVDIKSNESVVLKRGDQVTVNGTIDKGLFGTDINASTVTVDKGIAKAIGDTIESRTDISLEDADSYTINNLPRQGLVKITGMVIDVDNEKKFTLEDPTGSIDVDVDSAEAVALTKGAKVTVIGNVNDGMFGKDINAHKVLIVADAMPLVKDNP